VVVCGANGERSLIIEKAVEKFARENFERIIQISACTVAASPILVRMSGGDPEHLVAVSGCRNRCSELILKRAGMVPKVSVVLDDAVERELGKCESCAKFMFPDIKEEEWISFAKMMTDAIDRAL